MQRILIATHNKAKLKELAAFSQKLIEKGYEIVSLDDLHIDTEPEEIGTTFKENALLKAQFYAILSKLPTIADDGGIVIDALNGEPGVKSRRWPGYEASDEELIALTLSKLNKVSPEKRTAAISLCLCFYDPRTKKTLFSEATVKGIIADKPSAKAWPGFPYRSLFIVSAAHKYYDELTPEEHTQYNHRRKAMADLVDMLYPSTFKS